jgi:CRISPR system Cascade subunit CasB
MDSALQHRVLRWWQSMYLSPNELYKKGIMPAQNAQKAQLKRCRDIDAVMLTPGSRESRIQPRSATLSSAA